MHVASVYTWSAGEVTDVRAALDDLADRHRGESVVVWTDAAHLAIIASWVSTTGGEPEVVGDLVLEGDADGWRRLNGLR